MDKIVNFISERIAPPLIRVAETRYLQAIQKTFMTLMPLLMFSSFFVLASSLPFPGWKDFVAPILPELQAGTNATLGFLGVLVALVNGYYLGSYYKDKDPEISVISTSIMSFVALMMFFPVFKTEAGLNVISTAYFGSTGIFTSILLSILTVEMYRFLVGRKITIKMPEGVPPMVVEAFTALIPSVTVMFVVWLFALILKVNLPLIMNNLFTPLVAAGAEPIPQFFAFFIDRLLWFTGIHGTNVVNSVMKPIWMNLIASNIEAYQLGNAIPYLFTFEWLGAFVKISVLPICFLAAISKIKRFKTIGRMALPASVFQIAEPILFGLPVVLNPILFIPWVFGFTFMWWWSYLFTAVIPILPPIIAQVVWTVPAPIAAYLATGGSWVAGLFSLSNYFILGLIFYPFFKVMEKQELAKQKLEQEEQVLSYSEDN